MLVGGAVVATLLSACAGGVVSAGGPGPGPDRRTPSSGPTDAGLAMPLAGFRNLGARPGSGSLRLVDDGLEASGRACAAGLCVIGGISP